MSTVITITKNEKVIKEFILDNMITASLFYSRNWQYIEEEYGLSVFDPDVKVIFSNREM